MTMNSPKMASPAASRSRTQLETYPNDGQRFLCLGIVVLTTIVLYYQFYLAGALAAGTDGKNGILVDYHMSFLYYVNIVVVASVLGAIASYMAGIADRYGRVNIITVGLVIVSLLCLVGVPLADSKLGFAMVFAAVGLVEGMILVATPALIRDFSPQLGRASAMGFWTLGPVLGSLFVSIQVSSTSIFTPWRHQYITAGIVGMIVALLSGLFLRELSPRLRDQVMVSSRDRALVEARAKRIDIEASLRNPFRQMLKADIILAAFSISVFLILYYIAVGFYPVYFQTVFGFSQSEANSLGNWSWAFNAVALMLVGYLSDRTRVRKPFMVVGAIGSIVMAVIFATRSTHPETSYTAFAIILSLSSIFAGMTYAPWMASFTETVENRNPALVATGLAVWGFIIRIVVAVSIFIAPFIVTTVSTLVEQGPQAQALAAKYAPQLATAAELKPATAAALSRNPQDQTAGIEAIGEITKLPVADVAKIATLNATKGSAIQAARAIDSATLSALLMQKTNTAILQKAVAEITNAFGISAAQAQSRLAVLATLSAADLHLLKADGPKVAQGQAALVALGKVPVSDLALLKKVQAAARESPKQWRNYFWFAIGGQIVFVPLIFMLAGFWSPQAARRSEEEHEAFLQAELAKLTNRPCISLNMENGKA